MFSGHTLAHAALELLGCIPGPVGIVANGGNAVYYAVYDHDILSAALSGTACVTMGLGAIATKVAKAASASAHGVVSSGSALFRDNKEILARVLADI